MIPYLLSWSVFASVGFGPARRLSASALVGLLLFLTVLIGLRQEVGGDWQTYLPYLQRAEGLSLTQVLLATEPGYLLLNWLANFGGGGVFLVNTLCAIIFSLGLLIFCRAQPRPWLSLTLAFPYLVTVVAMGYSRQGVAIGLEMLALLALERDRLFEFLGWIALAATFHRTILVLLLLPAACITGSLRSTQALRLTLLVGAAYGLYSSMLSQDIDIYIQGYVESSYQSQGALIRVLLCLLPAMLFLPYRRRFRLAPGPQRIWSLLSILAIVSAIALAVTPSSTAVDRLALYLIPLQIFVGNRLPDARVFGVNPSSWNQLIIYFSFAVLVVWLLFAQTAFAWLPYRNLLLQLF